MSEGKTPAQPPALRAIDEMAQKLEPTRTLVYKRVGNIELRFHLFEPEGHRPSDARPCFLTFHGGGWMGGAARVFYPFADYFARRGVVGISSEYRLMKAHQVTPFECVKDGRSAVRFLRSHAAELGIDPNRIVVTGGSAGAHVAAGTALFDGIDEDGEDQRLSTRPDLLVLYYPVIDTSADGYGHAKCGPRWREISPLHQVRPGLPPTLLFHGTGDTVTPFKGAQRFHDAMLHAGNRCDLIPYEAGRHGYFLYDRALFADAMHKTHNFLMASSPPSPQTSSVASS